MGGTLAADDPIGHHASMDRRVRRAGRDVWAALEQATPAIVRALAPNGVVDVQYVVGFVHPFSIHVWLVTATDAERDALGSRNPGLPDVKSAILASGLPAEHATIDGTVAQSQETVDREYEGSWFYALR
jgi:hypothetical protein